MICYLYNYSLSRKLPRVPLSTRYPRVRLRKVPVFPRDFSSPDAEQMKDKVERHVVVFNRYLREHFVLLRSFTPPKQLAN